MKTLVTAFGEHLYHKKNSSQLLLKELPEKKGLVKAMLPVGYFRKDFLRPIKRYKPDRIIFLAQHELRKIPTFEKVARNKQITIKKRLPRLLITIYSHWLKWNNKNLMIKRQPKKEDLVIIPINKKSSKEISLHTKTPKNKEIKHSEDAGHYVCNYAIWVVEEYLQKHNPDTEFYFIHIPLKPTIAQKEAIKKFILRT